MQLSRYIDLNQIAYSSSGATVEVDTANCEGVLFIAVPGTTAARTASLALKSGATTTGFVNCATTHTFTSTAATHDILITDVYKPRQRWIGATISSTADAEYRLMAFKYGLRTGITTFSASGVAHATVPVVAGGIKRVISPSSAT